MSIGGVSQALACCHPRECFINRWLRSGVTGMTHRLGVLEHLNRYNTFDTLSPLYSIVYCPRVLYDFQSFQMIVEPLQLYRRREEGPVAHMAADTGTACLKEAGYKKTVAGKPLPLQPAIEAGGFFAPYTCMQSAPNNCSVCQPPTSPLAHIDKRHRATR